MPEIPQTQGRAATFNPIRCVLGQREQGCCGCGPREGLGPGRGAQHRALTVCVVVTCWRGDSDLLSHFTHITSRPSVWRLGSHLSSSGVDFSL